MSDPVIFGLSATAWTALATVAMAAAAVASVVVSFYLKASQDHVIELQTRLVELQNQSNWLNGALASHSQVMVRLEAERRGKKVLWWDPTHEGPEKKRPPVSSAHGETAVVDTVYAYVPLEERRYPKID
jgi:hypothetical protein